MLDGDRVACVGSARSQAIADVAIVEFSHAETASRDPLLATGSCCFKHSTRGTLRRPTDIARHYETCRGRFTAKPQLVECRV